MGLLSGTNPKYRRYMLLGLSPYDSTIIAPRAKSLSAKISAEPVPWLAGWSVGKTVEGAEWIKRRVQGVGRRVWSLGCWVKGVVPSV